MRSDKKAHSPKFEGHVKDANRTLSWWRISGEIIQQKEI